MKNLFIIRHAHALNSQDFADKDRPLSRIGETQALHVGTYCYAKGMKPDYWLCSPATRALETAKIAAQCMQYNPDYIKLEEILYEGSANSLFYLLSTLPNSKDNVFITGHNPALFALLNTLMPSGLLAFQPSQFAQLNLRAANWKTIKKNRAKLVDVYLPEV